MKRLMVFGTGFAVGYVLGAKAGRERYHQIMRLASDVQSNMPRSVGDLSGAASRKADSFTETARVRAHEKAHNVVDLADKKIDAVADHAQQIRQQSEERLDPTQNREPLAGSGAWPVP